MVKFVYVTPEFAIGPQISGDDFEPLRAAGFASVLNARPDDELGEYLAARDAEQLARAAGLGYAHSPTENHDVLEPEAVDRFEQALIELPKPIFAHCKTGTRNCDPLGAGRGPPSRRRKCHRHFEGSRPGT